VESSRKTEASAPLAPGGCPRCGVRLGEPYKYCPNCAYRLRPDLVPTSHVAAVPPPLSQRLVALGGYLLFAAMLLLVVFAGVRLFAQPEATEPVQPQVIRSRDAGCLDLTLDEFVDVPAGNAFFGLYEPGRQAVATDDEAAGEERKAAELVAHAIAELGDETTTPEQGAEALRTLREALALHSSATDLVLQCADALRAVTPHDPVAGIPDAWVVETPFRMARREITNDQYFEFLRAWSRKSGRPVPRHLIPSVWKRQTGSRDVGRIYNEGEGNHPVVGIPFDAALEFCGWFWEARLGADPDLVVDLPTWREFVLAARADRLQCNFPWGRTFHEARVRPNLDEGKLWSVTVRDGSSREDEFYNGFLDMVGNAAEWVYWDEDDAAYAGWSFEDAWVPKLHRGEAGSTRVVTPFSSDGFRIVPPWLPRSDVGFRPVIRRAPSLPAFVAVTPGLVRHGRCPEDLLPPERLDAEEAEDDDDLGHETLEQIRARREPPVKFADTEQVARGFEIAATEITNRQYLAFLAALAPSHTKEELQRLLPREWRRESLFLRRGEYYALRDDVEDERPVPRAFHGYYLPRESLDTLYAAGQENAPVQGITMPQAQEYATWLSGRLGRRCEIPTVAQYLRAGRGDGSAPYPWGDDRTDSELAPSHWLEADPRAFALFPTEGRPIVGLAGNVAELVRGDGDRPLLAGGFYYLPARLATLDCFFDMEWANVQFVIDPEEDESEDEERPADPRRPWLSSPRPLTYVTGFRIVRLPDPF
jgi:formylglycine-generating enzyme required for sulfatase activity